MAKHLRKASEEQAGRRNASGQRLPLSRAGLAPALREIANVGTDDQGFYGRRASSPTFAAALGYDGSYSRVAAIARDWKDARQREQKTTGRGVFVPLAVIAGERTNLQVGHFKLGYSRAFFLRAYPQQTHEMLFDAHNHAFRVLGGVPRRGIYDNMRTASCPAASLGRSTTSRSKVLRRRFGLISINVSRFKSP
jgi:hypothetical protein